MSKFKKKASIITLLALLPILTVALIFDSLWDSRASAAVSKLSMDIRGSWGPVLRVINEIHLPEHKITAKEYHQITPLLKPGMVLLTRMDWNATNLLLSGPFKHAAIYAGDGTVIEAVGSGVRKVDLMDFLLSKDRVRLVAPTFASRREMQNAAKFATSMVGRPYDYEFQLDNEYFYCFKLVYMSYNEARKLRKSLYPTTRDLDWQPNDFFGAPTVLASDFVDTPNWSVVYETVDQVYE